jgi:hypothetical protein
VRNRFAAALGLWVLCVGAVGALAWVAIDTAGQQVPSHAAAAGASAAGVPAVAVTAPGPADRPGLPGAPRAGAQDDAAAEFGSDAGRVRARCADARISLDGGYARPEPGWGVEVLDPGPEQVWVAFSGTGRTVEVIGRCADGRPRYEEHPQDGSPPPLADGRADGRPGPAGGTVPGPTRTWHARDPHGGGGRGRPGATPPAGSPTVPGTPPAPSTDPPAGTPPATEPPSPAPTPSAPAPAPTAAPTRAPVAPDDGRDAAGGNDGATAPVEPTASSS